jgi:transcriptional regulator with XRE-family HTH domain
MTFGEKVKYARKKAFLSQEAMAKELGVSFSTLNRWENGKSTEPNYAAQKAFHEFCVKNNIKFKGEED